MGATRRQTDGTWSLSAWRFVQRELGRMADDNDASRRLAATLEIRG
jgi:hypothetical protein